MKSKQQIEAGIAYHVWGNGEKTIVIDTALGTCSAEWWHIAEMLCGQYRVITFDRLGYGDSTSPENERTPQNIAVELNGLLTTLGVNNDIILLGHSQGGLYSIQYALLYPSKVIGMVLLDPATPYDDEFALRLTKAQYKKSGVDKTLGIRLGLILTSMRLGFLLKPMLKKMPPFYYYEFSEASKEYLFKSLCRRSSYKAALDEYNFSHNEGAVASVKDAIKKQSLGSLPIRLITHSSAVYRKELQEFGNMDSQTANTIESVWQDIMKMTLHLSDNAQHVIAPKSGHFIHLTDFDVMRDSLQSITG